MKSEDIEAEFDKFFEFPEENRSIVTSVSAKLFAQHIAKQIEGRVDALRAAIRKTLDESSHLADGEVCTLHALKVALRETGSPCAGEVQAELDALDERIDKLKVRTDNKIPEARPGAIYGFGATKTMGGVRKWYIGEDGVQRWVDNNMACDDWDSWLVGKSN